MIVIVMGVSGSGKSTVGKVLADRLGCAFHDGDDLHPAANVAKMASGLPLTDEDRWPWLERIGKIMRECEKTGQHAVIACSALRAIYREFLSRYSPDVRLVYLQGARDTILARLQHRIGHFMPADLLDSQLRTLEEPSDAVTVDVAKSPDEIVTEIVGALAPQN